MKKVKTLHEALRDRKLTSASAEGYARIREFIRGKKVKVIGNTNGHNYLVGGTFIVNPVGVVTPTSATNLNGLGCNQIKFSDLELLNSATTASGLKEELKEAKKTLAEAKDYYEATANEIALKLDYLKITGAKEYDENEFKVFSTLSVLDNPDITKMEKVKLIASLINN